MKNTINIVLLFSLVFLLSCGGSAGEGSKNPAELQFVDIQIPVFGMTCEGCESAISTSLLKLEGVGDVKASHLDKLVSVSVDTNITTIK
ncbi:MAG: hypothetical protein GQ527_08905, partial [Bacteroidales bacterium]|nr:hypothetical protein [Bacteroidales bacterium]